MNTAWVTEWLKAYNDQKYDKMMTMYADDLDFEDLVFGEVRRGKASFRELIDAFHSLGGVHKFEVVRYVGNESGGVVEFTWNAKLGGDFLGVPAAGKTINTRGVSVMSFNKDGKIVRQRDLWNARAVLQQLGVVQ